MEQLVQIGRLGKPDGVKGEINCFLTIALTSWLELTQQHSPLFLFAYQDGLPIPLQVESWRSKGAEGILMKFCRIDSRQVAERWSRSQLAIASSLLGEEIDFTPAHFVGFTLYDETETPLGIVEAVDDATANILFTVREASGRELLIPIADDLLIYVDADRREIGVKLPIGIKQL